MNSAARSILHRLRLSIQFLEILLHIYWLNASKPGLQKKKFTGHDPTQ